MDVPWKGKTMGELREEFVRRVQAKEKPKSALCREYGISRPTGDKWIARHERGEGMEDRSRAPFYTPNRVDAVTEKRIVDLRLKRPATGAKKLKRMLENAGFPAPAYSTINAILHRNGLISKEASAAATPHIRFEKSEPNEMWQADFKGHFKMRDGKRCHPLTVIDDHSRYCLCLDAKENERHEGVKESFIWAFERYGLPETLLCDNGNPWGTAQSVGYTKFEVWLMELGILTKHGRIRHPQTQGKDERFNGTLNQELLKYREIESYAHAQEEFDEHKRFYNEERPHHALGLATPSERYKRSNREFPQRIEEWAYEAGSHVKRIKSSGYLRLHGQGYFLSEAFGGKHIGVKKSEEETGVYQVYFRQFCVAKLDVNARAVIARKAFKPRPEAPETPKPGNGDGPWI